MVPVRKPNLAGHHLKDIVELSEKPSLNSHNPEYDKFGFEIEEERCPDKRGEGERRPSQENGAETTLSLEEVESRWDSIVSTLSKPVHLIMTLDMKNLIRKGVPINQKGTVWKAIVDNRMRRRPRSGYYQVYCSNWP